MKVLDLHFGQTKVIEITYLYKGLTKITPHNYIGVRNMGENKVNTLDENFTDKWFAEIDPRRKRTLLKILQALADSIGPLRFKEIREHSQLSESALTDGLDLLLRMKLIETEKEKYSINKDGKSVFNKSNQVEDLLNTKDINKFQNMDALDEESDGVPNLISHVTIDNIQTVNYAYPSGEFSLHLSVRLPDKKSQELINNWCRDEFVPGILSSFDQVPVESDAFRLTIIAAAKKKEEEKKEKSNL